MLLATKQRSFFILLINRRYFELRFFWFLINWNNRLCLYLDLLLPSYRALARKYEASGPTVQGAMSILEKEGLVYFLLADVHCLLGQTDTALDYLKKAIQKDRTFSVVAQNEPDFEALWEDKKFKLIVKLV